jgi:hypothetical protein
VADAALLAAGVVGTPFPYVIPGAQEIIPKAITASYDGTNAAGNFVPTLTILAPNGAIIASCPVSAPVLAGGLVDVSWFPHVAAAAAGAGGITSITSTTLTVTDPTGPTTDIEDIFLGWSGDGASPADIDANGASLYGAGTLQAGTNAPGATASLSSSGGTNAYIDLTNSSRISTFYADSDGSFRTTPPVSAGDTVLLGQAYFNSSNIDMVLQVTVLITVNAGGALLMGVGPTATPTQNTMFTGLTFTGPFPFSVYIPSGYYMLLTTTGTITAAAQSATITYV